MTCHTPSGGSHRRCRSLQLAVGCGLLLAASLCCWGSAEPENGNAVELSFQDNVELQLVVQFVSHQLGINIIYDEQIAGKRITIRTPKKVPRHSLLGLLESALQMKGLTLVDDEHQGWKRVVAATNLQAIATPLTPDRAATDDEPPPAAITQVFTLAHTSPQRLEPVVKPFLTQPGGNCIALPELRLLIVTDYSSNLTRVTDLVRMLDQPRKDIKVLFVTVEHATASVVAAPVAQGIAAKHQGPEVPGGAGRAVEVIADDRSNRILFVGPQEWVDEAVQILKDLDSPQGFQTHVYRLKATSPETADRLVKEMLGEADAKRVYRSSVDNDGGRLVVTAPPAIQLQVDTLLKEIDTVTNQESPIRFYKLENTTASNVIQTLVAIEGGETQGATGYGGSGKERDRRYSSSTDASRLDGATAGPLAALNTTGNSNSLSTQSPLTASPEYPGQFQARKKSRRDEFDQARVTAKTDRATITSDPNTNSIIIVAEPSVQRMYEQLIKTLDRRRPQVLLECIIVTLDTSNGFSFGVEISKSGTFGTGDDGTVNRTLSFSRFGLSEVNKNTGRLTLTPGLGFNGAVLSSDIADIVIRALSTNDRAKVMSVPKILVNDNATGVLASVAESPFSSVNASDTVATTSFGGYAEAGTTISLTPHISEGDFLQLEYNVTLNSFTGAAANGNPPPRQTNAVASEVTIPDGNTIVVGGLNYNTNTFGKDGVPILSDIPILEYLFSNRTQINANSSLFVFIRPVILRDDEFEDLKYLSQQDVQAAGLPGDYPASSPLTVQ